MKTFVAYLIPLSLFLLIGCAQDSSQNNQIPNDFGQPIAAKSIIVRNNTLNGQVEYAGYDQPNISDPYLLQKISPQLNWKALNNQQVINHQSGYPMTQPSSLYFMQDPSLNYYHYPNYYGAHGYQPYHHYPTYPGNLNHYFYQPAYYFNNAYYYYQPYNYFNPNHFLWPFAYSLYRSWW